MPIIPSDGNLNDSGAPDVYVREKTSAPIIAERGNRVAVLVGDFEYGPEFELTNCGSFAVCKSYFGNYNSSLKGFLDANALYDQSANNVLIMRVTPVDGTSAKSVYSVVNTHFTQDDAGNIVRFNVKEPGLFKATNVSIAAGTGSNSTIVVKGPLTQTDAGTILKFYYNGSGIGTGTSVLIEAGSLASTSKITINAGEVDEEEYDNVTMNELADTYAVSQINQNSSLVYVVRQSALNVDTLPTNQVETVMVTVETETHANLDMDETSPGTYIVDYINTNSDLIFATRLSLDSVDTLPTNQSATAFVNTLTLYVVQFEALVAGVDGDNLRVSITDGTTDTKTITVNNLLTGEIEVFSNLDMDDGSPASYIVDVVNAGSSLVEVTRIDTNPIDINPRNLQNAALISGSDGGATYANYTAKSSAGVDIATLKAKYRGTGGNNISVKITNNTTSVDVFLTDNDLQQETFRKLTMNSTDSKYLVDYINNNSKLVTSTRDSLITDLTLPTSLLVNTNLSSGVNGDAITDSDIQSAIAIIEQDDYVDAVTLGSQVEGSSSANYVRLIQMASEKRERQVVLNTPSGTSNTTAITYADNFSNKFAILTHPEQKILNPSTNEIDTIASAAHYTGRLSTLGFEQSPSRKPIVTLGNSIDISRIGQNSMLNQLTHANISPIGYIKDMGYVILNGVNTSGDELQNQVSTVSMASYLGRSLCDGLQPLVSRLHTRNLQIQVKSAIETFLLRQFNLGRIGSPDSNDPNDAFQVIVNSSVNTQATIQANMLIADVKVRLYAAADYIVINLEANPNVTFNF